MARESFRPAPADRTKIQVISTDETPMRIDLDGKLAPVPVDVEDVAPAVEESNGTTRDPAEWGDKNANDPKGVTPRVQKRFDRLKAETETERRIRQQAEQERDDAVRAATASRAEIDDLRRRLSDNTATTAKAMTDEREVRVKDATRRLEQAHAEGNSADMAAATADLSKANAELVAIAAATPRQLARTEQQQQPEQRQVQQPQRQAPQLHADTVKWIAANPRFNTDTEFTKTAMAIDTVLQAKGIRPGSPNYLAEVDRRMKAEYPDHKPVSGSRQDEADDEAETITPRRTNAVAPGSRETRQVTDSRTMDLSPEQTAIARSLGITKPKELALYALEIQKRNQNEKRGA